MVAQEHFRTCSEENDDQLKIEVCSLCYHDASPPIADLVVVFNGGIDSNFGSWSPSLMLLLERSSPLAFTGYLPFDDMGYERLLKLIGAHIVVQTTINPFRSLDYRRTNDGFLICVSGKDPSQGVPSTPAEISAVHKVERLAKLAELAVLNDKGGFVETAKRLRWLHMKLTSDSVSIPSSVNHGSLEQWAMGKRSADGVFELLLNEA